MKLEKLLESLNSLEKGPFIKIINNLVSEAKDNAELEEILSASDRNLKSADAVQLAQIFDLLKDKYAKEIMGDYTKATSQLDVLLGILSRDGNCIMSHEWFAKLYDEQIKHQKKAIAEFKSEVHTDKPSLSVERIRDYVVYANCLRTAFHNDEKQNLSPKITSDEQSILETLARELDLSFEEINMLKYSVLGIDKLSIDDVINDLREKGLIFVSRKTSTVFVADEVVSVIRKIRNKEIADKYYRRVLLQLKEPQINLICRKHRIDIKQSLKEKIEAIIASEVPFSAVLKDEIYKPDTKLVDRKKFVSELCDDKLMIKPAIKGSSLDDKVANLIAYFDNLFKDDKLGISSGGYERLINDLKELAPATNGIIKAAFQLQEEDVMKADKLSEYNIMPRDILELLPQEDISTLCEQRSIKTRGNVVENILMAYKDFENLLVENYESIGFRDLNTLRENGINLTEAELGTRFEEVTRYLFNKLGFNVDEDLRKKLNTEKDKMDILLRTGEDSVVLIECKTVKENGYNKFSAISRQVKSYQNLLQNKGFRVDKILLVAPDFSEDFVSDCGDDFQLNISLLKASSLSAIYNIVKETKSNKLSIQMFMKDVLVQEDRIIRAIKK